MVSAEAVNIAPAGFTVTVTESEAVQPFKSVVVTVYKVDKAGLATGFEIVVAESPVTGAH